MNITDIKGTLTLNNGVKMPYLGLGVFKSAEGGEVESAVKTALDVGYRLIDTASMYFNEKGVGEAVLDHTLSREEIFITTKVWNSDQGYESTKKAFYRSIRELNTDYIDLYLIHWPVKGKIKETWRAMEELYSEGRIKAIGVSNFQIHHIKELMETANIMPMVNQVELHPFLQQNELHNFCIETGIQIQAWGPLMRGRILEVDVLKQIGDKYDKSPVQVALRWYLQRGIITIPKSVKPERIVSNADIFDFRLSHEDMETISGLNKNERIGPDPDNFDF